MVERLKRLHDEIQLSVLTDFEELQHTQIQLHLTVIALTAFGTELLTVAHRNLQELDGVMSRIGPSASETGVSLSVGTPPLLMASVLAPAIQEFRSHRRELRFQLFDRDTTSVMQKVQSGALDMGMGVFFKYLPGVRRVRLFRFSVLVIRADNGHQSRAAMEYAGHVHAPGVSQGAACL